MIHRRIVLTVACAICLLLIGAQFISGPMANNIRAPYAAAPTPVSSNSAGSPYPDSVISALPENLPPPVQDIRAMLAAIAGAARAQNNAAPAPTIDPLRTHTLPPIPPGVPQHFSMGVANNDLPDMPAGSEWRYQYLSGGVNTGGGWYNWQPDGSFVTNYLTETRAAGLLPAFIYYQIVQSGPYNDTLSNMRDDAFMGAWFRDFKTLMQLSNGSEPVLVNLEPDMLGYWEQMAIVNGSNDPAYIPAQVAASGFPEAQGYPDNGVGVMQVFAHLRDLYAPNVVLGMDVSQWGPNNDVVVSLRNDPNYDWASHAITVGTFLNRAGTVPPGAGGYGLLFYSPLDRDAAYYAIIRHQNIWWDTNNAVEPTFSTMSQWLGQVISTTNRRALMWQVPNGNRLYRSENNTTYHYQDNRPEYFLLDNTGRAHITEWMNVGVVGMMFGAGAEGPLAGTEAQTTYWDDSRDNITNPEPINGNNLVATVSDDDGGFLRQGITAYYQTGTLPLPGSPPTSTPTSTPTGTWSTSTPTSTATSTPTWTFTPVLPTPTHGLADIYADSLVNNWESWSWGGNLTFSATEYVHSGTYAISDEFTFAWAGLQLGQQNNFNTENYTSLNFWINGGTASGQVLNLFVVNPAQTPGPMVPLNSYVEGGEVLSNTWSLVRVPLTDLGAENTTIRTVVVHDMSGHAQPAFYVDDIAFSSAPFATSTPTRTPTGTVTPVATPTQAACNMTFSDVHPNDYFYDAVQYLTCHGVVSGYPDGTFRPASLATRGQMAKIIVLATNLPINVFGGPHFTDVAAGSTFYDYVETAFNAGLISGYTNGTYRPNNNVSRGQLAKIVVNALGWEIDVSGGPHFPDVPQGSTFYDYVETAVQHGVINGYPDGTYGPNDPAKRGQITKVVYEALGSPENPQKK